MDWGSIKDEIISTEQRMEEAGLCMRLGGSISCRVDEEYFYFAGGGLREEAIAPGDIRRARYRRAQGEVGIHGAIYRARPDVNAVVFTRQCFGSALGILNQEKLAAEDAAGERVRILIVPFTLPGSDAQRSHVYRLASRDKSAGFLVAANHGAFAYGASIEDAFSSALSLERFARLFLKELGSTAVPCHVAEGFSSVRTAEGIRYARGDTPARVKRIHEVIYAKRPDVRAVVHNKSEAAAAVSRASDRLYPLYDDFVALVGPGVDIPRNYMGSDGRDAVYVADGVNASFCYGDGVYCYGQSEREARLVARSAEKACVAQLAAARMGGANILSRRDVRRLGRWKG